MSQYGPGDPPPVVVRRRKRRVQRRDRQQARQTQQAHAQESQYVSQGRAVEHAARQQQRAARKPRVVPRAAPPRGDTKADVHAGESFKRTKRYRGAIVASYDSLTTREKHQRLNQAARRVHGGHATEADHAVLHIHTSRVAGNRKRAGAVAAMRALGAPDPRDVAFPPTPTAAHPEPKAKRGSLLDHVVGAIRATGEASAKGWESVHAPKIVSNVPRDLADLTITTPSSIAKLASDAVHHPGKVPGELAAPYVELAKHPREFVTEHPASALLMVDPAVRVPGRAAGRGLRLAGKQTLERPDAVLPGTNLRVKRTGSRDALVRAVQKRRDVERGVSSEGRKFTYSRNPTVTDKQIGQRTDAFYDAARRQTERMVAGASREAKAAGLKGEEFDARVAGARKGAKKVVRTRFAEEFGGQIHDSKEAAKAAAESMGFEGRAVKAGKGKWTVVPEVAADRLRHHQSVGSTKALPARILRVSRRAFSRTVLPFSPRWLTGQAVESAFRALTVGAGPTSYLRGAKVLRALERTDPAAAAELRARAVPGGLSRVAGEVTDKTLADEFAGSALAKVARAATAAGKAPGVKQVRQLHGAVTNFVFESLNGRIVEATAQKAMLGRALKDSPLMERKVLGLSDRAIADAAKGLKATENQVALGKAVQRSFGKYSGFSPEVRSAILHWTPFLPWTVNMVRFLGHTLPVEHPVMAALVADVDAATEEWRKAHGLSFHKGGRRPGFLLGGAPAGKGGERTVRIGRYFPFLPGDAGVGALTDLLLPQFSGAYRAAQGQDPVTGRELHGVTEAQKALATAVELVESMVPAAGIAHRTIERGPNATFNPLAPTRAPKKKKKVRRRKGAPELLPLELPESGNPLLKLP